MNIYYFDKLFLGYLRIKTKVNSFLLIALIKLFMTSIDEQRQQQQPPSPTVETLQQKIDEFANGIVGLYGIFRDRKKTIIQQLHEIRQLAQDLSIDDMQLRDMIYESCTRIGVSPSWLRKMLPKNLKLTKHTRKIISNYSYNEINNHYNNNHSNNKKN